MKFGISPFGLGHNRPAGVKGFDPYEKLYADTELWMKHGWLDYLTPQLYWKISSPGQPFEPLVKFWVDANPMHRNIWPGLFTGKVGMPVEEESSTQPTTAPTTAPTTHEARRATAWDVDEILNQVRIARDTPGSSGAVHFSMKCLMTDRNGVAPALKDGPYKSPALVPASSWLDDQTPSKPNVSAHASGDGIHVTWSPGWGEKPWLWAVWEKHGDQWRFHVYPGPGAVLILTAQAPSASALWIDVEMKGSARSYAFGECLLPLPVRRSFAEIARWKGRVRVHAVDVRLVKSVCRQALTLTLSRRTGRGDQSQPRGPERRVEVVISRSQCPSFLREACQVRRAGAGSRARSVPDACQFRRRGSHAAGDRSRDRSEWRASAP